MAENENKLGREILADATKTAEQAVAKAHKEADAILAAARNRQAIRRTDRLAAAETETAARIGTRRAVGEVDSRRRSVLSLESVVQDVLNRAAQQVRSQDGIDRRRSLIGLLEEAAAAVGKTSLIVRMAPADLDRVGEPVVLETARRAAGSGPAGSVAIAPDASLEGGVIVESADGRLRFDNGPSARARRLSKLLRPRIARELGL
jgi:vacuolar-type H+-ATPase subunit E/Vma4